MSRTAAPAMPTEKQIRDLYQLVSTISPEAKISRIGPDGVTFDYGGRKQDNYRGGNGNSDADRPFSDRGKNG